MSNRRGGTQQRSQQINETWTRKPLNDQPNIQVLSTPSTSQQSLQTARTPTSHFNQKGPYFPKNRRKNQRDYRNRSAHFVKGRSPEKSELGFSYLGEEEGGQQKEVREELEEFRRGLESAVESKEDLNENTIECSQSVKEIDNIASRLEELQLGAEQLELSEKQMKLNDQLQEDELLAMEAIYGDHVVMLDRQSGLRCFQVHINIDAPTELTVIAKLNSPGELGKKTENADEFLYSFKVKHLAPIVLTCLLPKEYPSHLPPYFTISVQWLNSMKISSLCSMLDSNWNDQPGNEVIYRWVAWICDSSLSYLGFDKEIMLGPYGLSKSEDRRAVSLSVSPDVDIPLIKSFNDEKYHLNFSKSLHECSICFSEYAGREFVRLPCQHFFCLNCMKTYCEMHVKEGTVNKILCPEMKCGGSFPPGLLKRFLGNEEFERWDALMLRKTLDSMTDVAYCPRCETACVEDIDQHAQCSNCFFSFCTLCREKRHLGVACMTQELKLLVLQERQKLSHLKEDQKRVERELINEILSEREILRVAKQCPSCKMAISRTEGCNKMICQNCGQYFCYKCNKAIEGYEHFRDGACEVFPQEMIREWEYLNMEGGLNARQVLGQIQADLFADHGHACPNCRQRNAKVGNNNHIFCWACQSHYCYLCLKIVRNSAQHYSPKGCKQHTAG